jgi:hypothetical protein
MAKIPNSKPALVIEYWNLRLVCNLVLGVWDFIDSLYQLTPLRKKDSQSFVWVRPGFFISLHLI